MALHELRYRRAYRCLAEAAGRAQPGQSPMNKIERKSARAKARVRIINDAAEPAERGPHRPAGTPCQTTTTHGMLTPDEEETGAE